MEKQVWCRCAEALREYFQFENQLHKMNVDLSMSKTGRLADAMILMLGEGDLDWAYDTTAEINWLIVWASAEENQVGFKRSIRTDYGIEIQNIYLTDAEDICDFIVEMRSENWPVGVSARWTDLGGFCV